MEEVFHELLEHYPHLKGNFGNVRAYDIASYATYAHFEQAGTAEDTDETPTDLEQDEDEEEVMGMSLGMDGSIIEAD